MMTNQTARAPQPETTSALLMSAGIPKPTVTRHFYKCTQQVRLPDGSVVWEHIFECTRTGIARRWGTEMIAELEVN